MFKRIYDDKVANGSIIPLTEKEKKEHTYSRYVKPENPHLTLNYPGLVRGQRKGTRHGGYGNMTSTQKNKFVEIVKTGIGVYNACDEVGIQYTVLKKAIKDDPMFREMVKSAEESLQENLLSIARIRANEDQDPHLAIKLHEVIQESRAKSAASKLAAKNYQLKKKEVDAKVKALTHVSDAISKPVSFKCLSEEEFEQYSQIFMKINQGDIELTEEEYTIWGKLSLKVSSAQRLEDSKNTVRAIEAVSQFENSDD
jgi:hypothetical protein